LLLFPELVLGPTQKVVPALISRSGRTSEVSLPQVAGERLRTLPHRVREFVRTHAFEDYVCLGQGALYGVACESALKLTEMSVSYGQSFHTLEFRHGPKSIVSLRH
jgi:fructoselysine-6-P-deglycase FrlB-like protein